FAGYLHFLGIDDNDEVASVNVRGVFGLVLTAQAGSDFSGETTKGLASGVDDEPVMLYVGGFCTKGFHLTASGGLFQQGARILHKPLGHFNKISECFSMSGPVFARQIFV